MTDGATARGGEPAERWTKQPHQEERQPEVGKSDSDPRSDHHGRTSRRVTLPGCEQTKWDTYGEHEQQRSDAQQERVPAVEGHHLDDREPIRARHPPVAGEDPRHECEVVGHPRPVFAANRAHGEEHGH